MSIFNDRTGEETINNQGLKMKIIEYRGTDDIDVEFENGYVKYGTKYKYFKIGKIKNRLRVGLKNKNYYGECMTIVEYNGLNDTVVEFDDGNRVRTSYSFFTKGTVKNPMYKSVCNIGYLGLGEYKTSKNGKRSSEYIAWKNMIKRCYDYDFLNRNPSYKGCTVCEEWHNFQNFAKWYEENYYKVGSEKMHLDKDILIKRNKIYSPETCIFVPQRINSLFVKSDKSRGDLPIGVRSCGNKFRSKISIGKNNDKKCKELGIFNTKEEAFYAYKQAKEQYIKEVADAYKDKIPKKLYDAMYRWEVEITD